MAHHGSSNEEPDLRSDEVARLVDELIASWDPAELEADRWYFVSRRTRLLVAQPGFASLSAAEADVARRLREGLSKTELSNLSTLVEQRLAEPRRARHQAERRARERLRAEHAEQGTPDEQRAAAERNHAEARRVRKEALIERVRGHLHADFLGADVARAGAVDGHLLSDEEYGRVRAGFVKDWSAGWPGLELDAAQAGAVANLRGDVQVLARAGSGKTRTLVARAIFLQEHCGLAPYSLLLLAFNRRAAEEMRSRLTRHLGPRVPHVMTFHALAHAIVHPEERLVYDDPSTNQLAVSREVQSVIDEHIHADDEGRIRTLMLQHYGLDPERFVDDLLEDLRACPWESLNGEYVKSFGERVIANALFENAVRYAYERSHRWNGSIYRPDFTIETGPDTGLAIEYFGLAGNSEYDEMSAAKREYWHSKLGWTLFEFSPGDIRRRGEVGFVESLLAALRSAGIPTRRRTEDEIWGLVRRRAIDTFTKSMATFVGRCRTKGWDGDAIGLRVREHLNERNPDRAGASTSERLFVEIGAAVVADYERRLRTEHKQDFSGLVWDAVARVRGGQTAFSRAGGREQGDLSLLKHVLVDEFQDFSPMFHELLTAIRAVTPDANSFVVGDDWQAINGFAGSELRFLEDFTRQFRNASRHEVATNYRSTSSVVAIGNALMDGRGSPAVANRPDEGCVVVADLNKLEPSARERERHVRDSTTPAILRLVKASVDRGRDVVLLFRTNTPRGGIRYAESQRRAAGELDDFLAHVQSYLPEKDRRRVTASTVHKFKGLERDTVIVVDAVEDRYPFIHPTWPFFRIFGDTLETLDDAERRLFYVALTRARDDLVVLTNSPMESPYLDQIRTTMTPSSLNWSELSPVASLDDPRFEIRVSDAFAVRDVLKEQGYKWVASERCWHTSVLAEGFSLAALKGEAWRRGGVRVEVRSETGEVVYTF